ncbi:Uncharacterized protein GBIM_04773 [Gryllus bimaculatus]|nr:Uncharacterized protein GBIM_04773 [Gryllus bimaculatus]
MTTAQPAFNMAAATTATTASVAAAVPTPSSDLHQQVGGGGGGGGGGGNQQQQQNQPPQPQGQAAAAVVAVQQQVQQQVQAQGLNSSTSVTVVGSASQVAAVAAAAAAAAAAVNSVSITAVPLSALPQVGWNGAVECSLDSPGDSSNGGTSNGSSAAQVTAQVVVSSGGEPSVATPDSADQTNGAAAQAAGTTAIVGSPHYITVTVSESDAVGSDAVSQGVHPTYVQYVEGSEQAIYAATNGQMAYPVYTVGETGTMYTPATGQYYSGNTTAVTYSQVASSLAPGAATGQLLAQGNGTYLIQQGVDPDQAHTLIAAQRTSPQTVTAVSF